MTDGLANELTTLAELFNEAGYATAGIVANPWLGEAYGFSQGFEHYDHSHAGNDTPGENITAAALEWLATRKDERPFLLYLHYMDAHGPYLAIDEERFTAAEAELRADQSPLPPKARRTIARFSRDTEGRGLLRRGIPASRRLAQLAYDGGVEQFDAALGALLEGLPEALGAGSDAVALVVTSDHGESLYERGRGGHGNSLYREDVAIPLALRLPGLPPSQIDCPVSLIDVMATLVRYTGIAPSAHDHGRPLLLTGDETGSGGVAVSEAVIRRPGERSLVTRDYRVIHRPTHGDADPLWSWFAREPDPLETADLTAGPGGEPVPEDLARTLETAVPDWTGTAATRVPMDAETRDRLEALGYLGSEEE